MPTEAIKLDSGKLDRLMRPDAGVLACFWEHLPSPYEQDIRCPDAASACLEALARHLQSQSNLPTDCKTS